MSPMCTPRAGSAARYSDVPSVLNDSADGQLVFGELPFETKDKLTAEAQVLPVGKPVCFVTLARNSFVYGFRASARGCL